MLEALHRATASRSLVFGQGNYDLEFVGCLTHCLLELTSHRHQVFCDEGSNTQWHVSADDYDDEVTGDEESIQLLMRASTRVWQELYVHKKPVSMQ